MADNNFPLAWSEELSVGVEVIDNQHQHFINILNALYDATLNSGNASTVGALFLELKKYSTYHFSTEEKYFEELKYPDAAEHILAHRNLKKSLQLFDKRSKAGEDIVIELLNFIEDWLVQHLSYLDKKYTKWFNDHGLY